MSSYWSQYWQQGHLTSFGDDFSGNYTGVLKALWEELFQQIPNGQKVLDIGTGNGSLIALGQDVNAHLVYTGLDSAKLSIPDSLSNLTNMTFIEEAQAEKMPVSDSAFDYVISQFGIEYSSLSDSVPEVCRILKTGGHFQFILHDCESAIVKPNLAILNAAKALIASGLIETIRKLINALAKYGQKSSICEQLRHQLNAEIGNIANKHASALAGTGFPAFLKHVMQPNLALKQKKQDLKLFLTELEGQIVRLSDLVSAALTDEKYDQLKTLLTENQLDIVSDESIFEENKLIGRRISGIKASN
ncbi:class I SAM-dependent methyltransferase [Aliiglaciecola lipolytica]|uniref:Methyltransferase domain-containing protein n=1 Tax=Aliiglaciecola lipolytica E3 TaxID=1127673 RepID=K6X075_9ALTE|nr:class I SAM-dependent methyltransferase [Aliiglaciecola lipolytica]GAC14074.1 hypothetical protein GLIP_1439 [Aliiglaciecola lipolytica E3]